MSEFQHHCGDFEYADFENELFSQELINSIDGLGMQGLPKAYPAEHWAIQKGFARAQLLQSTILKIGNQRELPYAGSIRVLLTGAMRTGHFTGPKPAIHSMNAEVLFDEIIEGDLRVVFPYNVDPHSEQAISLVTDALLELGPISDTTMLRVSERWDRQMKSVLMFQYETLKEAKLGFEWEICINREPYYEIADVWDIVFGPDEIREQVTLRELLRSLRAPLDSHFNPTKAIQCRECRWRILASYGLDYLHSNRIFTIPEWVLEQLPLRGSVPIELQGLVKLWCTGIRDHPLCLNKPQEPLSESSKLFLLQFCALMHDPGMQSEIAACLEYKSEPKWTDYALQVQKVLQSTRYDLENINKAH